MKAQVRRKFHGMLAMLLSVALVFGCIPNTTLAAYAADEQESIQETAVLQADSVEEDKEDASLATEASESEEAGSAEDGGVDSGIVEETVSVFEETDTVFDGQESASDGNGDAVLAEQDAVSEELPAVQETDASQDAALEETAKEETESDTSDVLEIIEEVPDTDLFDEMGWTQEGTASEEEELTGDGSMGFPDVVVLGFDNDRLEWEDEYLDAKKNDTEYNLWWHGANLDLPGGPGEGWKLDKHWFINGYGWRFEENNETCEIPFYIAINQDKAAYQNLQAGDITIESDNPKVDWLQSAWVAEELDTLSYEDEGSNETTSYKYYKAFMEVKGRLWDCGEKEALKISFAGKEEVFYMVEAEVTPKYQLWDSAANDWETDWNYWVDGRLQLSVGDKLRVDFDSTYIPEEDKPGLNSRINYEGSAGIIVSPISAEAAKALAEHDREYGDGDSSRPDYYGFTYQDDNDQPQKNYFEITVSGEGLGIIFIDAFDGEEQIYMGCTLEFTSLPQIQLKQELADGSLAGNYLVQFDSFHEEETTNPVYPPKENVFKFYLFDSEDKPITGDNYTINPDARYCDLNWRYGGRNDFEPERFTLSADSAGKLYLQLDFSDVGEFPFPAQEEFNIWMDMGIVLKNDPSMQWEFRHRMYHEPELDLVAFGVNWDYDREEGPNEDVKQALRDEAYSNHADYDNNLYAELQLGEYHDDSKTVFTYVRIPEGKKSLGLEAYVAEDNNWISGNGVKKSISVNELWDYEGDTYYRIDLELLTDDNGSKMGKFTIKNGDDENTYSIYELVPFFAVKTAGIADWDNIEWEVFRDNENRERTIELAEGDSIRFNADGSFRNIQPNLFGIVSIENEDGYWLLGKEYDYYDETAEKDVWKDYRNDSLFKEPQIDAAAKTALGEMYREYGANGELLAFSYRDNGDKEWYPEVTVSKNGVNYARLRFLNAYGVEVADCRIQVANRPAYGFKQGNGSILKNFAVTERGEDEFDALAAPDKDNELRFTLCDGNGNEITQDYRDYYLANAKYQLRWRGVYDGRFNDESQENDIYLDNANGKVEIAINVGAIYQQFDEYPGFLFDPDERYELYLWFRLEREDGTFWDYEYALCHEEEERDVLFFGLGRDDNFDHVSQNAAWSEWLTSGNYINNAPAETWWGKDSEDEDREHVKQEYLGMAWQYLLEHQYEQTGYGANQEERFPDGVDVASWSGRYAGSATTLNRDFVPVYARVRTDRIDGTPSEPEVMKSLFRIQGWEFEVSYLGGCSYKGTEYAYYKLVLPNMYGDNGEPRPLDAGNDVTIETWLKNDTVETKSEITLCGMVVKYQVDTGEGWSDWFYCDDGRMVLLDKGSKIRFSIEGRAAEYSTVCGNVTNVCEKMFMPAALEGEAYEFWTSEEGGLGRDADEYGRKEENKRDDGYFYYNDFAMFWYGEDKANYPEFTVQDIEDVSEIEFNVMDPLGDVLGGERLQFSTLRQFTLCQGDEEGNLIGDVLQWKEEEGFRNAVRISANGIYRFYLCDGDGKKIDSTHPLPYQDIDFASMDAAFSRDTMDGDIWIEQEDFGGRDIHYIWEKDNDGSYYLQFDLSGKENSKWNNNWVKDDGRFWLLNDFDLWLNNIELRDTAKPDRGWRWEFGNYVLAGGIAMRQSGDETANLNRRGESALLPASISDGDKLRFYFYEMAGQTDWDEQEYQLRKDVDGLFDGEPYVWLNYNDEFWCTLNSDNEGEINYLESANGDKKLRVEFGEEKGVSYLELDLSGITDTDWEGNPIAFNRLTDNYQIKIQFNKKDTNDEFLWTREYYLFYAPAIALGWNTEEELDAEALIRNLAEDGYERMRSGDKAYADAATVYKKDNHVVLYVRLLKGTKLDGFSVEGISNNWVGGDGEDNWFTSVVSYNEIETDNPDYVFYRVELAGGEAPITYGAVQAVIGSGGHVFTLEEAKAQYRFDGGEWQDSGREFIFSPGQSAELNLATSMAYPNENEEGGYEKGGVLAMIKDYCWYDDNDSFELYADMPDAAREYWDKYYADIYGNYFGIYYNLADCDSTEENMLDMVSVNDIRAAKDEHGEYIWFEEEGKPSRKKYVYESNNQEYEAWLEESYADWGEFFIFEYEENGENKIFYPTLSANAFGANRADRKDFAFRVIHRAWEVTEDNNDPYWHWEENWEDACKVTFILREPVSLKDNEDVSLEGLDIGCAYTEEGGIPDFVLKVGDDELVPGRDYTYEVSGNQAVGLATITISGNGVYSGEIRKTFKVYGVLTYAFGTKWETMPDGEPLPEVPEGSFYLEGLDSLETVPEVEGYTFAWYADADCTQEVTGVSANTPASLTYYGGWTAKDYTVSFNMMEHGDAIISRDAAYGSKITEPEEPAAEGYTFGGWYKEEGCRNAWDFAKDTVSGNMTLYAKWTINSYTVSFNMMEHGDAIRSLTVDYGSTVSEPKTPAAEGYTFGGWYKEKDCKTAWNFAKDIVSGNTTLYAKWTKDSTQEDKVSYTVSFNMQGHGAAIASVSVNAGGTVSEPKAPAAEGYTFGGWYKEEGCKTAWDFAKDTVSGNTTLYAKWTAESTSENKAVYTVTFDLQGHGDAIKSVSVNEGDKVAEPKAPAAEGFIFGGWYKEKDCKSAWAFATDTVKADTTLYAKWTEEQKEEPKPDDDSVTPVDKDDAYYPLDDRTDLAALGLTVTGYKESRVYDGKPYMPAVKVGYIDGNGKKATLTEGIDYRILYKNNVKAGTGEIIIKGNGSYKGQKTVTFTTTGKPVKKLKAVAGGMGLNSTAEVPVYLYDGGKLLVLGKDYKISGKPDTSTKGKKFVTVEALSGSNYSGSRDIPVMVYDSDKILSANDVKLSNAADSSMDYTGKALKPQVVVTFGGAVLTEKKDYTVKYTNNKEAGTGFITVTGKKQYAGSVVLTFEIKPVAKTFEKGKEIKDVTYSGKAQKPKMKVTVGGKTLKAGKDYVLLYSDNVHAGTGKITVRGLGNYAGTPDKTFDFNIKKQDIKKASVKGTKAKLEISYAKKAIRENYDFTAAFGNEAGGKVEVTLTGNGDFTGTVTKKVKAN